MPEVITSIEQAETSLLAYSPEKQTGETYTLGRMRLLMERLGSPQNDIPAIHIAGTSGKTSTAYFIRTLLEAYGQKTGLTSSPHITSITERVQIGGQPLESQKFLDYLNEFIALIEQWPDIKPTYFELLTAFAFWVFKQESVDYMVIEVGLGGLLDATNVIGSSKVCVITPIGLDHTEVLGDTIAEIAVQKAGIIQTDSQVFMAEQSTDADQAIRNVCERQGAKLNTTKSATDISSEIPLFQQANFALARTVADYVAERDGLPKVSVDVLSSRITKTPPGRFEVYRLGDKTVILDGAHNPQKLHAFVKSLRLHYTEPIGWLVGFVAAPEQKVIACLQELAQEGDDYIFTDFTVGQDIKGRKSVPAEDVERLMAQATGKACEVISDASEALERLLATKKRTVAVAGSLYLVAKLRQAVIDQAT